MKTIPPILMAAAALCGCATISPQLEMAEAVNHQVNSQMAYESDAQQYGQTDRWVVEPLSGKGDCEDFAFTKAERLNAGGVVTGVDICLKGGDVPHAVAVVYDGGQEWVLDNLHPRAIRRQDYTCTRWLSAATLNKELHHGK